MFIGDSPNDDSMFSNFDHTVGVANIKPFIDELNSPPCYITQHSGGYGFAEMAKSLMAGH
jgi:hydroxymethylpyrimidine pyrophosphatase-like HAD family hydrolase